MNIYNAIKIISDILTLERFKYFHMLYDELLKIKYIQVNVMNVLSSILDDTHGKFKEKRKG